MRVVPGMTDSSEFIHNASFPQPDFNKIGINVAVMTHGQLVAEATNRFGQNSRQWKFLCPNCGDIACAQDYIDAGEPPDYVGQECIGRFVEGRGCSWAAFGLIDGPWFIVLAGVPGQSDATKVPCFPLAPKQVAP